MNKGRLPEEFRDRTKRFASTAIAVFVRLPKAREEVRVLGKQFLRSATSVAAHVREASRARSEAEFCSKMEGALQEADESQLWLELLRDDCGINDSALPTLHAEADPARRGAGTAVPPCVVYAIVNDDGKVYIGQTADIVIRLRSHNSGRVLSTRNGRPWKLAALETRIDRSAARWLERQLKHSSGARMRWLRDHHVPT